MCFIQLLETILQKYVIANLMQTAVNKNKRGKGEIEASCIVCNGSENVKISLFKRLILMIKNYYRRAGIGIKKGLLKYVTLCYTSIVLVFLECLGDLKDGLKYKL